jgi:hypothetical protein
MVAVPRNIPPSLWARLAALDARCDIRMERRCTNAREYASRKNFDREWSVEITDRATPEGRTVTCEFGTLAGALEGAVKMAEENGWAGVRRP